MKDHVTDKETSKKLKEAGIDPGESKFLWCKLKPTKDFVLLSAMEWFNCEREISKEYPAYMLSELLDMVEGEYELDASFRHQTSDCGILDYSVGKMKYFTANNPIEAVAQAILWQKEQVK